MRVERQSVADQGHGRRPHLRVRGIGQIRDDRHVRVEGGTAVKIGDWWHLYYDIYRDKKYGVRRTKDFTTWEDLSAELVMPKGIRHGTVLRVPRAVVNLIK